MINLILLKYVLGWGDYAYSWKWFFWDQTNPKASTKFFRHTQNRGYLVIFFFSRSIATLRAKFPHMHMQWKSNLLCSNSYGSQGNIDPVPREAQGSVQSHSIICLNLSSYLKDMCSDTLESCSYQNRHMIHIFSVSALL